MSQAWKNRGADCCSPISICLLTACCPCVVHGRITYRRAHDGQTKGWNMLNTSCLGWMALSMCGLQFIPQMLQRGELRKAHDLSGNACSDCLCAMCCVGCDLVQQDKEAATRGREHAALVLDQPGLVDDMEYHDA